MDGKLNNARKNLGFRKIIYVLSVWQCNTTSFWLLGDIARGMKRVVDAASMKAAFNIGI